MGRRPHDYQPIVPSEVYEERVRNVRPTYGYTIPDTIYMTGWSRSNIYNMFRDGRLPFSARGAHRRILGKDIRECYLNKV